MLAKWWDLKINVKRIFALGQPETDELIQESVGYSPSAIGIVPLGVIIQVFKILRFILIKKDLP